MSTTKSQQAKTIEEIADELENEIKMLTEILRLLRAGKSEREKDNSENEILKMLQEGNSDQQ